MEWIISYIEKNKKRIKIEYKKLHDYFNYLLENTLVLIYSCKNKKIIFI